MLKQLQLKFGFLLLVGALGSGCSALDSTRHQTANQGGSNQTTATQENDKQTATAAPCQNRYYPVRDGAIRRYKNSNGSKDTVVTQEYKNGEASFDEILTVDQVTLQQKWLCTDEGLIAPNYGSALDTPGLKLEPRHVSGVTLPRETELELGKTWTAVYKLAGTSDQLGKIDGDATVTNKVAALDESVTVPGGTFRALKIIAEIDLKMTMGNRKIPIPTVKSETWFAPNVGLIKSAPQQLGGALNNKMEYAGDK